VRAANICLQDKAFAIPEQFFTGALVPARSHLQACCQPPGGSKEYDFSDMAADRQIVNEKGDPLDLGTVINSTPGLIHTGRPDGYLDFFNHAWLSYLGQPLEHLLGWKWTAVIHPDDVDGIVEKWRASLASGEPFLHEARVLRADGQYRWMLHHKVALRNQQGEIVKWHGSSIDITDRKRAEEALRSSEAYLAEAQRLSHTGTFGWKPDSGEIVWTDETYRIFEYDRAAKPTLNMVLQRVHPDDRALAQQVIERASQTGIDFEHEYRLLLPDARIKHVHALAHVVQDASGNREFVGAVTDITERKTAEEKIRRLVEAGILGIFFANVDGAIVEANQAFLQMLQYDRQDLLSGRLRRTDLTPPEWYERDQRALAEAKANGTIQPYEKEYFRKDGTRVPVMIGSALFEGGNEGVAFVLDLSEQKRAQEALRCSEAYLAEAQRLSHTGSWAWSPDTDVRHWSEECYRILGFDSRDGLPRTEELIQRIHPDDQPAFRASTKRARHKMSDEEVDYRIVHPGGAVRDIHSIGHPVFSPSGDLIEFTGTVIDITERKAAEQALRSSEAYLAEAQRLSQTGSWAWSPDQDIRYWSEECYRVLSFDPQDGLPRFEDFFQRLHPDDQPGFRELIQRAIREKSAWEADYRIVHPDGPVRDIHVVAHPVLSASGHLLEFVGTVIDVTERKRAEEELRRNEAELRQMLDFTPQLIAVYGSHRERLYANRVALDYLGMNLDEWRQRSFGAEIHPDDLGPVRSFWEGAASNGSAHQSEVRFRKCDGSFRWFLVRFNPLHDEKGQITRWYIACTDIDDRKRAEEKLQLENAALREEIDQASMFEEIVGTSPVLQTVLSRISKVAPSDSTVLITGETGTGKELVARAIHRRSQRSGRAFISVNCAAIPRDLIASELFGHEKGAFTGAMQRRLGRFEMADGGTIFLDEVGELSPDTQVALLRVLQEREFERVGGGQPIRVDVRVIAATNRDLHAAVANGIFRQDLFYRLNVFPIEVPALRERKDDILMLVEYFVQRYARRAGKTVRSIEKKTLGLLQSYEWPGNIRELQNVIERSVILSSGEALSVDELWLSQETSQPVSRVEASAPSKRIPEPRSEREIIEAALAESRGRVSGPSGAAAKLGIPPSSLDHRIKALKIQKKQFKFR
jgi:PAS domain S-box-containing protein